MCLMCNKPEMTNKTKSPRSPWRRHLKEPMKPRLSRKIVTSARVNLNSCWSKFEEMSTVHSTVVFDLASTANVLTRFSSSSTVDNEINENLANEMKELGNI